MTLDSNLSNDFHQKIYNTDITNDLSEKHKNLKENDSHGKLNPIDPKIQTAAKVIHSFFLNPTWSLNSLPAEQHLLFKEMTFRVITDSGFSVFHPLTPSQFIEKLQITDKKEYTKFIENLAKTYPAEAVEMLYDNTLFTADEKSSILIRLLLHRLCTSVQLDPKPGDGKITPEQLKSYIAKTNMPCDGLFIFAVKVYTGLLQKNNTFPEQVPENTVNTLQKLPLSLFESNDSWSKKHIISEIARYLKGNCYATLNFLAWIPDVNLLDVIHFLEDAEKSGPLDVSLKISLVEAWKKYKPAHESLTLCWLLGLNTQVNQILSEDMPRQQKAKMLNSLFQTSLERLPPQDPGVPKKFVELLKKVIYYEPYQENVRQERIDQCIEGLAPDPDPLTFEILSHTIQNALEPSTSMPRGKTIDLDTLSKWLRLPITIGNDRLPVEGHRLILALLAAIQGIGTKRISDKLLSWVFNVYHWDDSHSVREYLPQFLAKLNEYRAKYPLAALPLLAIIASFENAHFPIEGLQRDLWKDAALRDPVFEIVLNLRTASQLSQQERQKILLACWPPEKKERKAVYTKSEMIAFKNKLQCVQTFLHLQETSPLLEAIEHSGNDLLKTLEKKLETTIQQKFGITHVQEFMEKYARLISKKRDPAALIIYCAQLLNWAKSLPEPKTQVENDPLFRLIGEIIEEINDTAAASKEKNKVPNRFEDYHRQISNLLEDILEDRLPACRYEIEHNEHLSAIASAAPDVLKKWMHDKKSYSVETWLSEAQLESKNVFFDSIGLLSQAIRDQHLGNTSQYPLLMNYLSGQTNPDFFDNAFQEKIEALKNIRSPTATKELERLAFEKKLIETFMKTHSIQTQNENQPKQMAEQLLPLFKHLLDEGVIFLGEQNAFIGDLRNIQLKLTALNQQHAFDPSRYKNWVVKRTDDWMDLLLVGTEVPGSCQDIHGDPELNRCLFSYMQDGKNQAFVLVDDKGRIQSRCIGRLLLLDGTKPVLFKEANYQRPIPSELNFLIDKLFLQTAQELNIWLLEKGPVSSRIVENEESFLESKGGPSPWEYVDALGNRESQNSSVFKIPLGACILQWM